MPVQNIRSVNVSRVELLSVLKKNREIHQKDYDEAVAAYHVALLSDLKKAVKKVANSTPEEALKFSFKSHAPMSYVYEYTSIIEMLEVSVDENVNLTSQEFQTYYKNEWTWTKSFNNLKAAYAVGTTSL